MKRFVKYFLMFISLTLFLAACSGPHHCIDIENAHHRALKIRFSVIEPSGEVRIGKVPDIEYVNFYTSNSEGNYASKKYLLWKITSISTLGSPLAELTYGSLPQGFKGSTAQKIRPEQKITVMSGGTGGPSINRPEIVLQ
jgi:hypothetical protein